MSLPKDDKPTSNSQPSNSGKQDNLGYCRHCDKLLEYKDTKFCPNCGKAVGDSSNNDTSTSIYEKPNVVRLLPYKSPGTAALIAFIGGIFGLCGLGHMYIGKVGRGIGILIGGLVLFGLALLAFTGLAILGFFGLGFGIGCGIGYLVLFVWQIFEARSLAEIFNKSVSTGGIYQIADNKQQSQMNDASIQSSNNGSVAVDSMNIQRTGRDYVVSGRIVNAGDSNSEAIRLKLRVTSVDNRENLYETTFTPSPNILGSNQYGDFSVPFSIKGVVDKFDYQVEIISE